MSKAPRVVLTLTVDVSDETPNDLHEITEALFQALPEHFHGLDADEGPRITVTHR